LAGHSDSKSSVLKCISSATLSKGREVLIAEIRGYQLGATKRAVHLTGRWAAGDVYLGEIWKGKAKGSNWRSPSSLGHSVGFNMTASV